MAFPDRNMGESQPVIRQLDETAIDARAARITQ
jgi:hypothetical protein